MLNEGERNMVEEKGFVRAAEEEEEEEEDEDRVREWEEGLPSLADLISLSQCLISPQLASAFSITSPSPSPARSSADVAFASHATFSSLRHTDLPSNDGVPQLTSHPLPPADCHGVLVDSPGTEHIRSHGRSESCYGETGLQSGAKNRSPGDGVSWRPYEGNSQAADGRQHRCHGGDASTQGKAALQDTAPMSNSASEQANARPPCTSEGSDIAPRGDVDGEAEEAESTPSSAENVNEEASARTLKRPRLVWTPELHKRFVDAVTHLGVRTAVPKTIMQLMNVEGLTRENVASHLQKYRLYLKRMQQGLSSDGPTASDHLFASTPLPGNFSTLGRFQPGLSTHVQDVNQVPFILSPNPISSNRGHIAGIMPGPLRPVDPYSYNVLARPPHDILDVHRLRQRHTDSTPHVPK